MHTWPQSKKKGLRCIGISGTLEGDGFVEQLSDTDDKLSDTD
jgi:hypothetical protein